MRVLAFADPAARSEERFALLFIQVEPDKDETVSSFLAARP